MTDTQIFHCKVKTVFSTAEPDKILIQYEDKVTAGNGRKVDFPDGKGEVCCQISELLFKKMEEAGIKTHYIDAYPRAIMCCKKLDILPVEVIVRNIAAGGICRETPFAEGMKLTPPLVEFNLKDDDKNDPLLTLDRVRLMGINPVPLIQSALKVNFNLKSLMSECGLDLVDFKLEYGYDEHGDLILADELSPDNMRLWNKATKERFDKDIFRKDEGNIVDAYKEVLVKLRQFT